MTPNRFPRYRGFNLLERFIVRRDHPQNFCEEDFQWIADWGFDFVRVPMDYRFWIKDRNPFRIDQSGLEAVDRAVALGQKYKIHVSLNLHRAPGYCVNDSRREEPFFLWKDAAALEAFCLHWETLAYRYRGIPNTQLSFDLVNEPPAISVELMTRADHARVVRKVVAAIRRIDPQRLIIVDGTSYGNFPCPELADLGIAQSCRAYLPANISHYRASWVWREGWPEPAWPGPGVWHDGSIVRWNRARLAQHYAPWIKLACTGAGVHCGEGGVFCHTPHAVALKWLEDVLDVLTSHGIGYALWNFRGTFGVLDSQRQDVKYQKWHGHQLDRKLLDLLVRY